uniref:non-specific serine/threonine protein kinase n=1 Tax=Araucaria cunninghamii TaxID=56994 RepID=A0A0D6QT12_ARACU
MLYNNSVQYWSSGEWMESMDNHFPNLPEIYAYKGMGEFHFRNISSSSMYFIYETKDHIPKFTVRFIMHKSGDLRLYVSTGNRWSLIWSKPGDLCDVYDVCGAYGVCNGNNTQFCRCLEGFMPKHNCSWSSEEWWSSGCIRLSPLQCSANNGTTDRFLEMSDKSLPHEQSVPYIREKTLDGCHNACLNNCSCTAFALSSSTPPTCRLWLGSLSNLRDSSDGQPFFVRLAASDFDSSLSKKRIGIALRTILAPAVGAFIAVLALFALFIWWKREELSTEGREDGMPTSLPIFTYSQLQTATRNFKHKMGSGAFGSVFEGTLPDNTLVAVKKLDSSIQAEKQFRAEINTIGNIHHVNLVRLLGFCIEGSQRLLVYEYVSNGSLDSSLFGMSDGEPKVLDWKTRFQIALGTARALVYLHEKCKDCIIHCDIKPENILLDEDLCPKLADFGLAKIMDRDFSKVLTTTRGTRGYLAPEWIDGLPITTKVDVYSFGVTMLEIITGRRNMEAIVQESSMHFFTTWAATQIYEEKVVAIVDANIVGNADMEEVRRAAMAGVLCIQEDPDSRPTMVQVLQMLEGTMESHAPEFQEVEEDRYSIV